jgi:hypothetical protein
MFAASSVLLSFGSDSSKGSQRTRWRLHIIESKVVAAVSVVWRHYQERCRQYHQPSTQTGLHPVTEGKAL